MKTYQASANIKATPETIWKVLINGKGYPDWDQGMIRVEGNFALGERLKFLTKFSPTRAFPVKITVFEPGKKMVLQGGLPLGLFKSERTHLLTPSPDGQQVTVTTKEVFSGLLYPLLGAKIPDLTDNFQLFVSGLKRKCEGK